jgi:hypothetical protein
MPNWKRVIVSGSDAALNSLNVSTSLTASGLIYPTADNGEESFIQTDGNGTLSLQYVKTIYEEIYNGEATQLVKGTPVYVSGSVGAAARVFRADAGNPAKMPVIYISADTLAAGQTGRGIALGLIKGIDLTGYTAGTEVYVAVGGGWTPTRPTGSAIVQTLGYVTKEGAGGQGVILNPGPNSLPNLPSGSVWVGSSSSLPTPVLTSSLSVASASFASTASFLNSNTNAFIQGGNSFGTTATLGTNDNQSLQFETNGTTKMFISSSGNVGIGTTNPQGVLNIVRASSGATRSTTAQELVLEHPFNVGMSLLGGEAKIAFGDAAASEAGLIQYVHSSDYMAFRTANTEKLRIDSSGNVGIGTTSPTRTLQVVGEAAIPTLGVGSGGFFLASSNGQYGLFGGVAGASGDTWLQAMRNNTATAYNILLNPVGGNVGIGLGLIASQARLHVVSSVVSDTGMILATNSNSLNSGAGIDFQYNSGTSALRRIARILPSVQSGGGGNLLFQTAPSATGVYDTKMTILREGNVGIGTTTPNSRLDVNGNTTITGSLAVSQSLLQYSNITSVTSGSTSNVASFSTGSYTAAFFDYVTTSGTNARAGTVFTVWNANNVEFTETSTNDIGNTSNLVLSASLSAGAIRLQATSLSGSWSVKTLARML